MRYTVVSDLSGTQSGTGGVCVASVCEEKRGHVIDLEYRDIRDGLPRKTWEIGRRIETKYLVIHFNGPKVAAARQRGTGVLEQLKIDCDWQMAPGWSGVASGADGLQYHAVIDQDGIIYQTRDWDAMLWHCGHRDGNEKGISIHLLVGVDEKTEVFQPMSDAMKDSLVALMRSFRDAYGISRDRVVGHKELGTTAYCPGEPAMTIIRARRAGSDVPDLHETPLPTSLAVYRVPLGLRATVRQGPGRSFPVAGDMYARHQDKWVWVDSVHTDANGEEIAGSSTWAHMAYIPNQQPDLGFIHMSALRLVQEAETGEPDQGIPDACLILETDTRAPDVHLLSRLNASSSHLSETKKADIVQAYGYCGRVFGISNWLAFHQAALETGWFSSRRFLDQNNVAGIGATNDGALGEAFASIEQAVFVQFLHLYHYACREDASAFLKAAEDINPRLGALTKTHGRGSAPRWVDLHQKWAVVPAGQPVPGPLDPNAYGMKILRMARRD